MLLFVNIACGTAFAAQDGKKIIFNGRDLGIGAMQSGGCTMVPFKALMNGIGIYVGYDDADREYFAEINGYEARVPVDGARACYDSVWIELDTPTTELDGDVGVEVGYIAKIYGFSVSDDTDAVRINAKIEKQEENEEEFDVEEYLGGITPKNTPFDEEDLFGAKISDPALISQEVVDVTDAPGYTKALELKNLTEPELYYRAQVTMPNAEAIAAGDVVYATVYAKKIICVDESNMSKFDFCIEALDSTWTKFLTRIDTVGDKWTKFTYVFSPSKDVPAGGAQLGLRIGFRYQTIQFCGLSVVNYGKNADMALIDPAKVVVTTYHGREDGALWREEAFKRIEKYRKNDINVEVTDEDGNPISGAKVDAAMTRSEFIWGTASNASLAFDWLGVSRRYQEILKTDFNSLTNESSMKPESLGNISGRANTVNFARDNNMHFRAHAILWDAMKHMPQGVISEDATEEELLSFLKSYAARVLCTYGDTLTEIDVLNEPLNNHFFMDKYGTDFVAELFKTVKDINPNIRCFINEIGAGGESTERLCALIDELQAKGAPVEGIGLQNHTYSMGYPQELYNQIDDLTKNLKYAAITEYDYISGLSDSTEALRCEADYLRDSIILAYSHPKMTGFTMWGFGDFCHWRGNAPLYFSSYSAKPALEEWRKYVWGEWFTNESAQTDADGEATIRGHRGDYNITVTVNGKTAVMPFKLTKDGENTVKAVVSDSGVTLTPSLTPDKSLEPMPLKYAQYNEEQIGKSYLKLYENTAVSAVRSDGTDVSFLMDTANDFVCSLDKNTGIVLTAGENGGEYITLRTSDGTEGLFLIEGIDGDKTEKLYAGETTGGMICVPTGGAAQVRVTGLTQARSMLRYAGISQARNRY